MLSERPRGATGPVTGPRVPFADGPATVAVPATAIAPPRGGDGLLHIRRGARLLAALRLTTAFAKQLVPFLVVDTVAAVVRRRSLAASAGRRMHLALVGLGPAYVRLARLLASQAGVVPGSALAGFASATEPPPRAMKIEVVEAAITEAVGPPATAFAAFDRHPLATTAVAQLHVATLPDGTPVVVKVRRDGLEAQGAEQALAISLTAGIVARLLPKGVTIDRPSLIRHLTDVHTTELDLRAEAAQQALIAADLAGSPDIVVPRPIPAMVSRRVLVMERLDGVALDQAADQVSPERLGSAVAMLLRGAARTGIFHADLRPANLLALEDGRLGLVDFGNCCQIAEHEREGLSRLLDAVARGDVRRQLQALDEMGSVGPDVDRRALLAKLAWVEHHHGELWKVDPLHDVPQLFLQLADSGIQVPIPVLRLAENLLHLEATARGAGTSLDLGHHLTSTCRREGRRRDPYGPALTADEVATAAPPVIERRRPSLRDVFPAAKRLGSAINPEGTSMLASFSPLLVFIVANSTIGVLPAVLGATGWTLGLSARRRSKGKEAGTAVKVATGLILFQGTLGVVFRSGKAFFGPTLIIPTLIGVVLAGSVVIGRPLFGIVGNAIWPQPPAVRRSPEVARTHAMLTLLVAGIHFLIVAVNIWLLMTVSANTFAGLHFAIAQIQGPLLLGPLWFACRVAARGPEIERRIMARAALT